MWEWLVNYGGFLGLPSMKDIYTIPERWNQGRDELGQEKARWGVDPAWLEHQRMGLSPMPKGFIAEVPSVENYRRGLLPPSEEDIRRRR